MMRISAAALIALTVFAIWPSDAEASSKCVRIVRQGNIETMVNTCNVCMVTSIIRSRPGSQVPVGRQFNVQARNTFPVPFRGPGRTRIKSERPCPGEQGADQDLLKSFNQPNAKPQCVKMERSARAGIVLVNRCGLCKAVAVQLATADGGTTARDYFALAGNSSMPVRSNGYAQVGLLGEIDCPTN